VRCRHLPNDPHCFRTNVLHIHAIGDVIPGPMLVHKAMSEGHAVVETIGGGHGMVNYDVIPAVVYTDPEVAWIGKTEAELKEAGVSYKSGSFPFTANSRAKTVGHTAGMAKVLTDAETAIVMEFGGSAEDIARTCHAHPTLSEAVQEAASLAAFGKAIHV